MNNVCFILILFSLFFGDAFSQGTLSFGDEDQNYNDQGFGDETDQGQGQQKGGTGLQRKRLSDKMEVLSQTDITDVEKCKIKCNMNFSTCYRVKTDRGECYKIQQECLGKCGGEEQPGFGEDPSGGQEYGF